MDDLPFCSVRLSLSKALWYMLKSIPVDSKHMLQGCPIFEPGTGTVRNFGVLRHPSHESRGESAVRETGVTCQRTYFSRTYCQSCFVLKTHKHLKQKAAMEATQEDAVRGAGLWRGEGQPEPCEHMSYWCGHKIQDGRHVSRCGSVWLGRRVLDRSCGACRVFHRPSDPWLSH